MKPHCTKRTNIDQQLMQSWLSTWFQIRLSRNYELILRRSNQIYRCMIAFHQIWRRRGKIFPHTEMKKDFVITMRRGGDNPNFAWRISSELNFFFFLRSYLTFLPERMNVYFYITGPGLITSINFTIGKAIVGRSEVKNPAPAWIILEKNIRYSLF